VHKAQAQARSIRIGNQQPARSRFDPMDNEVPLADIPDGGTLSIMLPSGNRVCLIRRGDQVSALRDECTHQAMPLSAGEVLPDGTIECAWHGARFDCATGAVLRGPAEESVQAYEVRVTGETVLVKARDGQ
jgi:3-phenylpropionate/trans-cinnamate dioxygenase ferredoxin subunit